MYDVPDQTGRTFIVTGANSGTGREATKRLAAAGAHVIMAVRTPSKGEQAKAEILAELSESARQGAKLEVRQLDLADLASVRAFAEGIITDGTPIDVLINNAGVMAPPKRQSTSDGLELQFGSNFVGPFALTNLLLGRLLESSAPRVVTMSSFVANFGSIRFDDLQWEKRYIPFGAYAQSKLADQLMGQKLADVARSRHWNLLSTTAHPGYTRTNLQSSGANLGREGKPKEPVTRTIMPSQEVSVGAEPLLFAATSPAAEQGGYYGPSKMFGLTGPTKKTKLPRSARRAGVTDRLVTIAENLSGTALPTA
jgi:NAD(P)-dependent dehydrogenase (short-subunit alcohol dehydrogenase family)